MDIYCAGIEAIDKITRRVIGEDRVRCAFASYYLLRKRGTNYMPFYRDHIQKLIVDSGAHSFFSELSGMDTASVVRKKSRTEITPHEYWETYKAWLVENQLYLDYFAELDIGELVGQGTVEEWREELRDLGLMSKCITVYHPAVMDEERWLRMLDESESRYVALEGLRGGKARFPYLDRVRQCYERGVRVHGFAMVKNKWMNLVPFTSVDSISWKAGAMFGAVYNADDEGKVGVIRSNRREGMESLRGKVGPELLTRATKAERERALYDVMCTGADAMQVRERHFTSLWKARGVEWDAA